MIAALDQLRPHHEELRKRLIRCGIALLLTSTIAYLLKDEIAAAFMRPLYLAYPQLGKLVYTKLTEAFLAYLKLSLLVGLAVASPYFLTQIWLFVSPGLLEREKKLAGTILLWSTSLFAGGVLFAFYVVLPRLLHYFLSYASQSLLPMLKLGLYLTFTGRMLLAFGLAFEIPFLMVMAIRTGLINKAYFRTKRIYFYGLILTLAFLLAAGDFTATILLALPLAGLYEAGILAGQLFGRPATEPDTTAPLP